MTSANEIIADHITRARERIDHARRQHSAATEEDRPAWQLQAQADEQSLTVLLELQDQVRLGADPAALSEQRREELRKTAEGIDLARNHGAHILGLQGGIAEEAIVMRAIAPFTAMANLHGDLWKASRTAA